MRAAATTSATDAGAVSERSRLSRLPKRRPRKPLPTTGTDVTTTGAAGGIRNHAVSAASTTIALFAVPIAIGCSPLSTFCVLVISFAISSHTSSSSGSGGGPSNIWMARARAEIAACDSRSAVAACGAPTAAETGRSEGKLFAAGIGVGPTIIDEARGKRESTSATRDAEIDDMHVIVLELDLRDLVGARRRCADR